jgi:hypothetical protein
MKVKIETKVITYFTNSEKSTLQAAASLLLDFACETEGVSDELCERSKEAYEFIRDLLDLEG